MVLISTLDFNQAAAAFTLNLFVKNFPVLQEMFILVYRYDIKDRVPILKATELTEKMDSIYPLVF